MRSERFWPVAAEEWIVAAVLAPGAVASELARAAGIHTSQLFRWRRQLCGSTATFAPVAILSDAAAAASTIEIEHMGCTRMRIMGAADPAIVSALIAAIAKIGRMR